MKRVHANTPSKMWRRRNTYRNKLDLLRRRVSLLTGKDKLLLTMYLDKGNSFRQMARLAGVNETMIARRIYKVMKRLMDGEYISCLKNRRRFTNIEMAIAKDYFLTGLSIKEIAQERHLTYYHVRETIKHIQRINATAQQQSPPPQPIKQTGRPSEAGSTTGN